MTFLVFVLLAVQVEVVAVVPEEIVVVVPEGFVVVVRPYLYVNNLIPKCSIAYY